MKRSLLENPRLKKAFREAYLENARQTLHPNGPGENFNFTVMREIRHIAGAKAKKSRFEWLPRTAWRLAPVACGIVFALTIFLIQYDPAFEYDMAALTLMDPIGFNETNLFSF